MDLPRGKPVGGRARGKAQEASQGGQQAFQKQHGPSSAAPPPQLSGWGPRGRGSAGGAPPQQQQQRGSARGSAAGGPPQQQQCGPEQMVQQMQKLTVSAGWGPRGRGSAGGAPPQQQQQRGSARGSAAGGPPQQQQCGPEQMVQQMQKLTVSAVGDPGASTSGAAPARGGSEPTRGNMRQKNVDDTYMFRSETLSAKQGTRGKQVMLQANYFKYMKRADVHLFQYRVDFEPNIDVTVVRKAILRNHKEQFGKAYVFDGTVLYTQQRLKDGLELTSKNNKDDSIVRILIKLTTDLQMGDPHYVSFLNQILRGCLAKMDLQLVRRDYYDAKAKIELHQHKLEIWPGYKTSVRQHENDLLMVCDLSSKVMRHESAFAFLMSCRQRSSCDHQRIFTEAMIGSVVITPYNNRTYMIDDIDWKLNPSSTFVMKGRTVSYRDYFKEKHQLNITSDEQPMLISKPKEKDKRGGRGDQNICLVPELSFLTGVDDNMRADFNLMKAIAEYTRLPPNKQIERLEQGFMKRLNTTKPCQESLALWNMAFEPRLVSFPGRILPPENIIVGDQATLPTDPILGQFTRPLTSSRCRLLDPAQMNSWAIVYPQKMNHRDIVNFCQALAKSCHTLGFHIPEPHFEKIADDRNGTYVNAIELLVSSGRFTLLMTVVPNVRADRYEAIKKKCYVQRITPNQVVLAKNITNKNLMSVATKIGIQMCCKVGGSPWTTSIPFKGPTMIVGFDVCHDTYMKKSVGALVASLNAQHTRYFSSVSFHDSGEEICKFMAIEMQKALAKYMEINGVIPERIFFYRDSVGEGNLHYVLENEVKGICDQWKASYGTECPLTLIVVSKGIKTKIYQKGSNPPPGTVVDSVITLPTMYDFYLVSQSVRQGTVNPTSYNVIYDQQNLRPDIVQQLSYKLTHMYFNWSGTIRVPAPCQYAHKLAGLVGQHIHTSPTGMDDLLYFL